MFRYFHIFVIAIAATVGGSDVRSQADEPSHVPPLKVVYFVPSDMEPLPDRARRLGRTMRYVQDFYRREMQRNGFGPMTFALEWDAADALKMYVVTGQKKQREYGRQDAWAVRDEVREGMRAQYGVDVDREYVIIFQLLLLTENGTSTELGPYVGSGTHLSGTAWVYDDPRLDADLLPSKDTGGYYHGPCSLGQFNTHYIGGLAHEMGHAFSLPHACELDTQRQRDGRALMGGGNHTFGQELRGEGKGTFLAASSALRLSRVRAFAGDIPAAGEMVSWKIEEMHAEELPAGAQRKRFALAGRVSATPPLVGVIAYHDNMDVNGDYDAKTWVAKPDEHGRFRMEIREIENAPYQLRLVGVHENGATSHSDFTYLADPDRIHLSAINDSAAIKELRRLFAEKDVAALNELTRKYAKNNDLQQKTQWLIQLLAPPDPVDVAEMPAEIHEADLTWAKFMEARTAWRGVHRGQVPDDVFIQMDGHFYSAGLYAHAPSVYSLRLGGVWKTFQTGFGLQDGNVGPTRFILRGDGRELFRSDVIRDNRPRSETVSVEGVQTLELIVESPAEQNRGAWSVWTNPILRR